jgi:membrane-associated phospholipid phosphatase
MLFIKVIFNSMLIRAVIITILLNCLVFSQSDKFVYNTDTVMIENKMENAQNPSQNFGDIYMPKWYEFVTNTPLNMYNVVTNSFSLDNLPALGYISVVTAALILTDPPTHSAVKTFFKDNPSLKYFGKDAVYIGNGGIEFGVGGLFALYGVSFSDDRALRTGLQCTEAIISNGIMVQILKRIFGRESPVKVASGSGIWHFFPNLAKYQKDQPKYYSFPSGHLSTAMTVLTVIAENYPEAGYIKPVGYSLMGLLGIGLVAKDMHWFSDFPLAIALGYEFGKVITSRNVSVNKSIETSDNLDVSFMPLFLPKGGGINMLMSF